MDENFRIGIACLSSVIIMGGAIALVYFQNRHELENSDKKMAWVFLYLFSFPTFFGIYMVFQ